MNFNVYVNKKIGDRVKKVAKSMHRSRNSIVTEALQEWLEHHTSKSWPKNFFDFQAAEDVPNFKSYRDDLKPPSEDPLA